MSAQIMSGKCLCNLDLFIKSNKQLVKTKNSDLYRNSRFLMIFTFDFYYQDKSTYSCMYIFL